MRSALIACALSSACTPVGDFATQDTGLDVRVDADEQVRAGIGDVEVAIESRTPAAKSWSLQTSQRFTPGLEASDWPLSLRIESYDATATYQVTATSRDEAGAVSIQVRAIAAPNLPAPREVRLRLDRECLHRTMLCGRTLTCSLGDCIEANAPLRERSGTATTEGAQSGAESGPMAAPELAASACAMRGMGARFCDASGLIYQCQDAATAVPAPCDENEQCVETANDVRCDCRPGFVRENQLCTEPVDCRGDGACDAATMCQMDGDKRACTACPTGYAGTGETGCEPLPAALSVTPGTFDRAFDPNLYDYQVRVPSVAARVAVTVQLGVPAQLTIDNQSAQSGVPWQSPILGDAPTPIAVTLRTDKGVRSDYHLTVTRDPASQTYLKASNGRSGDQFGGYVAAYGDTIVVGAPYETSNSQLPDGATTSIANAGAAYVFVRDGNGWRQQDYLKSDQIKNADFFGTSVAIWKDRIAVGAPGDLLSSFATGTPNGSVHIYERSGDKWPHRLRLDSSSAADSGDSFGFRVELREDRLLVGAPLDDGGATRSGAAYLYAWDGMSWQQPEPFKAPMPISESRFGSALAFDDDTIVVGAFAESQSGLTRSGASYAYTRGASGWSTGQRIVAPTPRDLAQFGAAVGVQGKTVVVSAPHNSFELGSNHSGAVFVFEATGTEYRAVQTIESARPSVGDEFGSHALLKGGSLLVGAPGEASEAFEYGAVYLFGAGDKGFAPVASYGPTGADNKDYFGYVLGMTDGFVVVGAPQEDSAAHGVNVDSTDNSQLQSGAVYVLQ